MRNTFYAMKLTGYFRTKTSYMSKVHGQFDLSCHDPFNIQQYLI